MGLLTNGTSSSKWEFNTCGSESFGVWYIAAEKGYFVLDDLTKTKQRLEYWGAGIGLSLPIGKWLGKASAVIPGAAKSDESNDSYGNVYHDRMKAELTLKDFQGPCAFVSASGAIGKGGSLSIMFFGLDQALLPLAGTPLTGVFFNSAKGMILSRSEIDGFQVPGVAACIGHMGTPPATFLKHPYIHSLRAMQQRLQDDMKVRIDNTRVARPRILPSMHASHNIHSTHALEKQILHGRRTLPIR